MAWNCFYEAQADALPIDVIERNQAQAWLATQPTHIKNWIEQTATLKDAHVLLIPSPEGSLQSILLLIEGKGTERTTFARAAQTLPAGQYFCRTFPAGLDLPQAYLGWALGHYSFSKFKSSPLEHPQRQLGWHPSIDRDLVLRLATAISLARHLITTPASHLGPEDLCTAITEHLSPFGSEIKILKGTELIAHNYPAIHTVGKASARQPCLLEVTWGNEKDPALCLVGKGVCFDSGGLDLKPASGMLLMKKDMAGAAIVTALAYLLMSQKVPLRGRLLIAAVENSVSGDAYRPLDVITMRKGLTVEVGDTDAEGRLILADCLTEAASHHPHLVIDCATLTGAARVALGTDVAAAFSQPEQIAQDLHRQGKKYADPVWPMPLHSPYKSQLKSSIADLSSTGSGGYGGAITAALFLQHFITPQTPWLHVDMMAWNLKSEPGKPEGGEAQALQSLFALVLEWVEQPQKYSELLESIGKS